MRLVSSKQKIMRGRNGMSSSLGIGNTGKLWHSDPLCLYNNLWSPSGQRLPRCQGFTCYPWLSTKVSACTSLPWAVLPQITYRPSKIQSNSRFHNLVPSYLFQLISPISSLYLVNGIILWFPNMANLILSVSLFLLFWGTTYLTKNPSLSTQSQVMMPSHSPEGFS